MIALSSWLVLLLTTIVPSPRFAHHVWAFGEECAYGQVGAGQTAMAQKPYAYVTRIDEVLDARGRTIAVLYATSRKRFAIQGNALTTQAQRNRFHVELYGLWTSINWIDPKTIPYRIIACRLEHITRAGASTIRINADAAFAY